MDRCSTSGMDVREAVMKLFSGGLFLAVLEFAAIAAFTNMLGSGAIGSFFLFRTIVGIVGIPTDFGVSRAAEKALSAGDRTGEVLSTAVLVKFLFILPWLMGLILVGSRVENYIGAEGTTILVALGIVGQQGQQLAIRLLSGQLMVHRTALLRVLGKVVWLSAGFGLIWAGLESPAIMMSFIAGNLTVIVLALYRMKISLAWPTLSRARSLVDFGKYIFIGSAGGFLYSWMDVAILRLFAPPSVIGAYEIAWRVASLSMLLTRAIREALFAQISQWHSNGDLKSISNAFFTWLPVPLYMTIPAFLGIVVLGKNMLHTLFGANVVVAYPVLIIFGFEKIVRSLHLILSPSLFAMDKPELAYRGSIASIVANLVLNLLLIPKIGMIGAAIATTISAGVAAFISTRYLMRFVKLSLPWSQVSWSVTCSLVMAGVVYVIVQLLTLGWLQLVVGVGTGILLYSGMMLMNMPIRMRVREEIAEL
jgi:O-antigen/teichoic acid export membrane protein